MNKLKYIEFMKLYFNKTQANLLIKTYKGRELNKEFHSKTLHTYESKNITDHSRRNRIVLTYILLILYLISFSFLSFFNILWLLAFLLVPFFIFVLLNTLNFSLLKIFIYQKFYNNNSNPYKMLLNELFINKNFKGILDIDNHIECIENTNVSLFKNKIRLYHNKKYLNVILRRNKIIFKSGRRKDIICNNKSSFSDFKQMLNDKINNYFKTKSNKYEWVNKSIIYKNKKFKAYGYNLKLKHLQNLKKIIQINESNLPNVKEAQKYRFLDKDFNEYFILLAKLDENTYALFEKQECK